MIDNDPPNYIGVGLIDKVCVRCRYIIRQKDSCTCSIYSVPFIAQSYLYMRCDSWEEEEPECFSCSYRSKKLDVGFDWCEKRDSCLPIGKRSCEYWEGKWLPK